MDAIPTEDLASILGAGYDALTQRLRLTLASGRSYDHYAVPPQVFDGLLRAPSMAAFYEDHIRGRYRVDAVGMGTGAVFGAGSPTGR